MSLNAVQLHVLSLLNGITVPGQSDTLTAYVTPPVVEALDGPRAYIWGGTGREQRRSAPRGYGFKRVNWSVDTFLVYETDSESSDLDETFPLILDAVMGALRAAPMPTQLTDPTTGAVSQMTAIGEDFTIEMPPERLLSPPRLLYYAARVTTTVTEDVQA